MMQLLHAWKPSPKAKYMNILAISLFFSNNSGQLQTNKNKWAYRKTLQSNRFQQKYNFMALIYFKSFLV